MTEQHEQTKYFEIHSDLNAVPGVVGQIIGMSAHLFENVYMLEVAVYEAIYNAIEHGNLEVSKEEKERMIEEGCYDSFIASRCSGEGAGDRIVKIRSTVNEKSQTIEIEDQGRGFDWRSEMRSVISEQNRSPEGFNGFGIKIIASVFNILEYNETGNRVKLVKFADRKRPEDNVKENSHC